MSDSEDSIITYTAVFSPYGGLSDIGSPGVDGPPVIPEDPYAYVVVSFPALPSPDYVPATASPTTESPGHIDEFDPKDDPEEDPADYPADGGEEGDDEDESSDDDEDEDIDIEGDKEEDEYLAPADSTVVALPAIDHVPSAEETEPFMTDEFAATPLPHLAYRVTARMSIRPQTSISLPSDTKIARLMAIHTPPPSILSPLSSPLPQIPSPLVPLLSPPPTDPTYKEAPLGYRVARLLWRAEREEIPEADRPLRKRLCTTHTGTYELGESSAAATASLKEPVRDDLYSDAAYSGAIALRTQVAAQRTEIIDLRATDHKFQTTIETQQEEIRELQAGHRKLQAQFIQVLTALKLCQTQLTAALGRIQILEAARVPAQPEKMTPKRTTRANPDTTTTTTTNSVTDAQLEALIEQGVARALAAHNADRT
nr:hypothetical protein [Tanacetum cinerariifolium]